MSSTTQPLSGQRPLISIAIPTYNRKPYIEKLLTSLEAEFKDMAPAEVARVELVVSNNNSQDETAAFVEGMKARLPNLQTFQQARNLGPYENIITVIERSRAEWVWIHGDDDVSVPGGFAKLFRLLAKSETDYVVLYDSRFERPYDGEFRGSVREFIAFCSRTHPYLLLEHSLITSNVFRKELFDPELMRKWVATDYGHLYSLMSGALAADSRVCVPDFAVFHIPEDRPPFECWPDNIDRSWRDYLVWLSGKSGVPINAEQAMEYTRSRLKNELKHPLRFVRKNYQNLFRFGAYPFFIKRLFTLFWKKG